MALFNFGKKKEEKPKAAKPKAEAPKKVVEKKPSQPRGEKTVLGDAYKVLKSPHVTEKATDLTENDQYAFNVYKRANKKDVKRAVEDVFGVDVVSVNIINIPRKKLRVGRTQGTKPGYKKAIVRVAKGQKIEILPR